MAEIASATVTRLDGYLPLVAIPDWDTHRIHRYLSKIVGSRDETKHIWDLREASPEIRSKGVDWIIHVRAPGGFKEQTEIPIAKAPIVTVTEGATYAFRLPTSPTMTADKKRFVITTASDQVAWLHRRGDEHGFAVLEAATQPIKRSVQTPEKKHAFGIHGCLFTGRLRVTDVDKLNHAMAHGICIHRTWGFGLLSIRPIQES
jgi:CRISPR-associated protein Cas6/Cse3/CasE subtype I-E